MSIDLINDLKIDFEKLVRSYVELKLNSFPAFVSLWKKNSFDLIYAGQGETDIDYFLFHVFDVAKRFCIKSKEKLETVAGLYLLYLLYYTQPLKIRKRIRLAPDDFVFMKELAEEYKSINKEVTYAFYKLLLDYAFEFVVTSLPYDENFIHRKEEIKAQVQGPVQTENQKATIKSVIEDVGFDKNEWSKLVSEYNLSKLKINNCCSLNLNLTKNLEDS